VSPSIGAALRRARKVRALSAVEAARAAGISAAYLSKLENDAVKRPSPPVLLQLSEALTVPYADLMRLTGYQVPGESAASPVVNANATLFADVTNEERDELIDYLEWISARRHAAKPAAAEARARGRS
jgi:transcriptional regulator with XRE-family HTH domain